MGIDQPWDAVGHHEAGHAVIARVLGLGVFYVKIGIDEDDPRNCGDVHHWPAPPDTTILICLAGPLAESRYTGQPPDWIRAGAGDEEIIRECLPRMWRPRSREEMEAKVVAMVASHWPAISRVADELLISRRIDGPRLDELIARADATQREAENNA